MTIMHETTEPRDLTVKLFVQCKVLEDESGTKRIAQILESHARLLRKDGEWDHAVSDKGNQDFRDGAKLAWKASWKNPKED